jgi:hypothetical protein
MDYGTYLRRLDAVAGQPPPMLEPLDTAEAYAAGVEHIREVGLGRRRAERRHHIVSQFASTRLG